MCLLISRMKWQLGLAQVFVLVLPLVAGAQQPPACTSTIEYANRNQVDPKHANVRRLSGRVIMEVGNPAKQMGPVPACLGLFTEKDHRLMATAFANEEGRFKFDSIPAGLFRLVVRDPQNAFCPANMPLRVVTSPRGNTKSLVIHLRPTGIDDCSYGDFTRRALNPHPPVAAKNAVIRNLAI